MRSHQKLLLPLRIPPFLLPVFELKRNPKNVVAILPHRHVRDHDGGMAWCEVVERTLNLGIDTTGGFLALPFTSDVSF